MVPSSLRITSGEPALAQAAAHSALIGFFNSFVNAHAESRTYPFTEIDRAAPVEAKTVTSKMQVNASLALLFGVMCQPHANELRWGWHRERWPRERIRLDFARFAT